MTFDNSLHEVCVRVGVRYVITKISRMDSSPDFLTHGAPQVPARAPLLPEIIAKGSYNDTIMIDVRMQQIFKKSSKLMLVGGIFFFFFFHSTEI